MFLFSRHYAIERFGVIFIVLSLLMTLLTGSIVFKKKKSDKAIQANTVIYTPTITMSKSGATASVLRCMTDESKKKCFILLKFNSEDMSLISIDAKKYRMFVTGANSNFDPIDLGTNRPAGGLYVFGQTGYMGLYLINNEPWESQIMNVIIRNMEDYSGKDIGNAAVTQDTFSQYDQAALYFNPGGKNMEHAAFLDEKEIDLMKMYKEAVIYDREVEIKATLLEDLRQMDTEKRKADLYLDRLTSGKNGAALADPGLPTAIAGDVITAKADGADLSWNNEANGWINGEGRLESPENIMYYYTPSYIVPGGYDFNWQDVSIDDGWIDSLRGSVSIDSYLKTHSEEQSSAIENTADMQRDWTYQDGSAFVHEVVTEDTDSSTSDPTVVGLNRDIENLYACWQSYYDIKRQYQLDDLASLLYLEREVNTVLSSYSVNFDKESFILW